MILSDPSSNSHKVLDVMELLQTLLWALKMEGEFVTLHLKSNSSHTRKMFQFSPKLALNHNMAALGILGCGV